MRKGFYLKLAAMNLKKNSRTYGPYILTCLCTMAVFYIVCSIACNEGIRQLRGGDYVYGILSIGSGILGIFSVIFLFYTNSFLMKQRKRELALYNILGMEKRHIARILGCESLLVFVGSFLLGTGGGILLSRLFFLLLLKINGIQTPLEFSVSLKTIRSSFLLFLAIFVCILLNNLRQIHIANPMELLQSSRAGEREPKTRWLLALLGIVLTGGGYWLAIRTENVLQAVNNLFVAILLVMLGTYALFVAGTVAFLKALKKSPSFYYKARHFTTVSGLIYRMKQNAVGLANICILSTAVLLTVSTTVSLYFGNEDTIRARYPHDIYLSFTGIASENVREEISDTVEEAVAKAGLQVEKSAYQNSLAISVIRKGDVLFTSDEAQENGYTVTLQNISMIYLMTGEEYTRLTGEDAGVTEAGNVAVYTSNGTIPRQLNLYGQEYQVTGTLPASPAAEGSDRVDEMTKTYYVVVEDLAQLQAIDQKEQELLGREESFVSLSANIDLTGTEDQKEQAAALIETAVKGQEFEGLSFSYLESRQVGRQDMLAMNSSFFFLGIVLGAVFLMATVLIIYYKQISEGYEDKKRYEIMEKVGMSQKEVRKSIQSQTVKVFFLPLGMAVLHISAAFPLMRQVLQMMSLDNWRLFLACTGGTVLIFAIIYFAVYGLTARTYYKIVR